MSDLHNEFLLLIIHSYRSSDLILSSLKLKPEGVRKIFTKFKKRNHVKVFKAKFTLTAITFEQEICLSVQKDVASSWMNPQIQSLQLVPVWCFILSDHWIFRKLFLIAGEAPMSQNNFFPVCSFL